MFVALARLAFQRHWSILGATLLLLAGAVAALVRGGKLTTGTIEGTEADRAQQLVEKVAGLSGDSVLAVILRSARLGVGEPPFVSELQRLTDATRALPSVDAVTSPLEAPPALAVHLISTDGHAALLLVRLRGDLRAAVQAYPEVRSALASSVLEITITGKPAFLRNLDLLLERDLLRAELISFPLALIVLLMVFRTAVAALMPLLVGGLAVMTGVAGVMLLSHVTNMAQYTLNVVSLIGLGVAIDYSLFIVTRFRSELGSGASLQLALERTFDTAGRAVAFSGLAVGVGLAGLFFYRGSYLCAMGLAGAIVVGSAVLFALTFLPALLSLLGERIERGRIPLPTLADRGETFDLIFIDADKENNVAYVEWAIRLGVPGSIIVVDNIARFGRVLEPAPDDLQASAVRDMLEMMGANPRLDAAAIQTVGTKGWDGFAVAIITEPVD